MTSPPAAGEDRRVDDLRQQLRALGYLDAGVDRFVLAPAVRRHRPGVIAFLASVRSGSMAAMLLGPAAAIGLAARLPGLVTGVRDGVVIAIYMAVLFGAAVAALSFVAALAVSFVARSSPQRGRALSTAAGFIVSIACLAYLTLWWRTANAGFGWQAPVWTAFALLVAVAISLLVGHVVTLTARAVVVVRTPADAPPVPVPASSWKLAVAAGALAFAGAASLLMLTTDGPPAQSPAAPLSVRSAGARVTVIAIDGFDVNVYPQSPFQEGTFALLVPTDSRDPARLWTTIATGHPPETHGVQRLETRRVAGLQGRLTTPAVGRLIEGATDLLRLTQPAVASNLERQTKTFWEIAAQAGLRTCVVNWWATWPADVSAGTIISDRAILRLERGGALDAEIAPADVYDALKPTWPQLRDAARARAARFFSTKDLTQLPPLPAEARKVLMRAAELDAVTWELAEATGTSMDLTVLYLPGLDIVQHTLFGVEPPAPFEMGERLAALRQYYAYTLSLIGGTLGRPGPARTIFVITQPGRLHQGAGMLAVSGPNLRVVRTRGTVLDVAPTVLHALGLPVARDLGGRVLDMLFEPQFLVRYPVRSVESYGRRGGRAPARGAQPLDEEMIERLRSLGYVR